jgi:hypothetical protein
MYSTKYSTKYSLYSTFVFGCRRKIPSCHVRWFIGITQTVPRELAKDMWPLRALLAPETDIHLANRNVFKGGVSVIPPYHTSAPSK